MTVRQEGGVEKRIRWRILKPSVDTTIYENLLVNCFINCAYYRVFIPPFRFPCTREIERVVSNPFAGRGESSYRDVYRSPQV